MIRLGLIGEIGSGKTFVGKCFGYPIFNADAEVRKIYKKNKNCFKKLNKKFPNYIKKFPILKSEIKNIINKKNLPLLSKIIHPYVRLNLKKFLNKNKKKKYVVLDIPLLIENRIQRKSDILIYVRATNKIIVKRLKKRGNYNKKLVTLLKSRQLSMRKKIRLSNFVIENISTKNRVLEQVKKIKKVLND